MILKVSRDILVGARINLDDFPIADFMSVKSRLEAVRLYW